MENSDKNVKMYRVIDALKQIPLSSKKVGYTIAGLKKKKPIKINVVPNSSFDRAAFFRKLNPLEPEEKEKEKEKEEQIGRAHV